MNNDHLASPFVAGICRHLKRGLPRTTLSGVAGGALAWLLPRLAEKEPGPLVVVVPGVSRVDSLQRELLFFTRGAAIPILSFPAWETLPFEGLSPHGPLMAERLCALSHLAHLQGESPLASGSESGLSRTVILTTPNALMQRVMPRSLLMKHGFTIATGDRLDLPAFREYLARSGFRHAAQVAESGEFSVRGGILDLFPPTLSEPVRIELFGDEVEQLRLFDPVSQRAHDAIPKVSVLPAREVIMNEETIRSFRTNYRAAFGGAADGDALYKDISQGIAAQGCEHYLPFFHDSSETLFDYLPEGSCLLVDGEVDGALARREQEIAARYDNLTRDNPDHRILPPQGLYLTAQEVQGEMGRFRAVGFIRHEDQGMTALGVLPAPTCEQERQDHPAQALFPALAEMLKSRLEAGNKVILTARTFGQRERLLELFMDRKIATTVVDGWEQALAIPAGRAALAVGDVEEGFFLPESGVLLLPEESLFGKRVRSRRLDASQIDQLLAAFAELGEGDPVVHVDYGVGRYGGLHSLEVGGVKNDFLLLHYAGNDKLYVPVESLDRVGKYTGGEEAPLDRLGNPKWQKTKAKARKRIFEIAQELVKLQAQREMAEGYSFSHADPLYQEFSAAFPFEETPDQLSAIEATLADMASKKPMDRLVCGDVGFGKTEVALRAAFRAVMDGKQVVLLAPTTILVQQHYDTFVDRFAPYPIRIAQLSRFRTSGEQNKTVMEINEGKVDVIIGTHRVLREDIVFKELGLVMVDEEQRFGVVHKERIKRFRASVDLLTLTATPIPRTLHMALSGVRDISIIATPPPGRQAIRTIVTQYDPHTVREAILREIYRGGQVFYLHNSVEEIERVASQLADLVPEAKVGVAHGQMRESRLERIMSAFHHGEFNVLVCTTIIENGVDIPTANTILINRADRFGLAQLHQLRGRVGRSKRRAYAYMLIPDRSRLTGDAEKRLEAIETLGELGSGFLLANHDLEIRGAGNLLGEQQSGQIKEVGFELYNQMLQEAVKNLAAGGGEGEKEEEIVPQISLSLSTYLPAEYVPDVHQRLGLYKRIASLGNAEDISEMRVELADRFGKLPETVENLLKVVGLKRLCVQMKIIKIEAGPKGGVIGFHEQPRVDPMAVLTLIQSGRGSITFNQEKRALSIADRPWEDPKRRLVELGALLQQISLA